MEVTGNQGRTGVMFRAADCGESFRDLHDRQGAVRNGRSMSEVRNDSDFRLELLSAVRVEDGA
jgi:hypothetical protein